MNNRKIDRLRKNYYNQYSDFTKAIHLPQYNASKRENKKS